MNFVYKGLIEQIRRNIPDLEITVQHILETWPKVSMPVNKPNIELDSVAWNLNSFYSGIERLYKAIAKYVDRKVLDGKSWHYDLLWQMTQDIINVRPAVIKQKTATMLDEFRRFRNVAHNIYSTKLDPERMVKMMSILPELWQNLRAELLAFTEFLEESATQDNTNGSE